MSRWQPDARERLERAALELFTEQGFAVTTVPQITARAGLTTRTFFRHFSDKREVLFAAEDEMIEESKHFVADAPPELTGLELMVHGIEQVATTRFEGRREYLRQWRAVVDSDEGLRERSLKKIATLGEVVAAGLIQRGSGELAAELTARVGVTVLNVATTRWLADDDDRPLVDHLHETLRTLRSVVMQQLPD